MFKMINMFKSFNMFKVFKMFKMFITTSPSHWNSLSTPEAGKNWHKTPITFHPNTGVSRVARFIFCGPVREYYSRHG